MISFTCPDCLSHGRNLIEPAECPQCGSKKLLKIPNEKPEVITPGVISKPKISILSRIKRLFSD